MTTPGTASTSDARKRKAERETEQPPTLPDAIRIKVDVDLAGARRLRDIARARALASPVREPGRSEAEIKAEALREFADTRGVNIGDEDALMCVMLGSPKPITPTYPPDSPLARIKR